MVAKNISGNAPGGQRTPLKDVLPLNTPFVVQIFPIYACNFKCNYCIFSTKPEKRGFISDKVIMDFNLYKKCIDDMCSFPEKIKVLRFVGIGEPLLHKNIIEMIDYAVQRKVANKVELLTNASLLSKEISDGLIQVGLSRLVVSLQGVSKEKYKQTSDIDIDFDSFIDNLKYFYKNKTKTDVYIKIVDTALENETEEQEFYKKFGNICDSLAIEHTVPIHTGIEYKNVLKNKNAELTQFGLPISDVAVCPQPFFTMQINPDGKIVPCFSFEYPEIVGDCNNQSMVEIWNSPKFQNFRRKMLDGTEQASETCKNCSIIKYRLFPEDDLSNDAERLKQFYE